MSVNIPDNQPHRMPNRTGSSSGYHRGYQLGVTEFADKMLRPTEPGGWVFGHPQIAKLVLVIVRWIFHEFNSGSIIFSTLHKSL